jgi:hypothetical protein
MKTGYAFENRTPKWRISPDDLWETAVHAATGQERFLGQRRIDGSTVNVWTDGTAHFAQVAL